MAKSPTTVAGAYPLSDLLFSPRAAFIWNHTRKSVVWMNPAARAAFDLRLEDFSASLSASLIRRFAQFTARKEGGGAKVKIPGVPGLNCSIEILKLADGQDGLIVAELGEGEEIQPAPVISTFRKPAKSPKKTLRETVTGQRRTAPTLTAEELRAFKAVGRKVLRLCEDKDQRSKVAAVAVSLPAPSDIASSPERPAHALRDILAAFDLVLFLGENLDIVGIQGQAVRLGLRKAKLAGKSLGDLVLPYDRTILRRMMKKLRCQAAYGSRDALLISGENGNAKPCRAILGRWEDGDAAFFLALLSLDLPARLKRPQRLDSLAAARLAA
ncbi:MAG TPA: hypothetical protein VNR65_17010 [Geobacterales bacterium]|nr:hypothetical protein [Geobacterales bacterium]